MKNPLIAIGIVVGLLLSIIAFKGSKSEDSHFPIRVFNRTGELTLGVTKIFTDTFNLTTGNGYTVDLSAAGFVDPPRVHVTATRNTSDPLLVPNVAVKTVTATTLVVNTTEFAGTTLLGVGVGQTAFVATPSSITIFVQAMGR